MKPLASVAMKLVAVVLVARANGYDALPDPSSAGCWCLGSTPTA